MVVTFCGHSTLSIEETKYLEEKLFMEIEKLILKGAEEFLLGGYGNFDFISAKTVKKLKNKYPHIKSVLVIPYLNREYNSISLYDATEYPPIEKVPKKLAIIKRNEYMVDKSDVVIAYVKFSWGGARITLDYAIKKKKKIKML